MHLKLLQLTHIIRMLALLSILSVYGCSTPSPGTTVYQGKGTPEPVKQEEPLVLPDNDAILRARILADILYAAKYAFDDNKLLLPEGDNAYDRYLEVLSVDPYNEVAIEGIKEIVVRYVELADDAMSSGRYDNAEAMLNRAATIDPGSDDILAAIFRLEEARKIKIDFFELDEEALTQQSIEMLVRLAEIAEAIKMGEATFLITARTDEEGRWVYKIMRESVGGYRLRGDISLGSVPGIQVNFPSS